AGATPAQAMAFALCTAIQFANDCLARGLRPDEFLPRFTFFFDISLSFFEEVAKFRAGRRIWARIVRERFKADGERACRFKFHSQTSGADLTRQQPLNNIARVAVQAMAGIFGGTQSLHTDAYDEVLTTPTEEPSRIAVNTQNILREEAHLTDVIDPLGGSYYVESLTNQMEAEIEAAVAQIDALGGMYQAVESGAVQRMIGESALAFQERIESGTQTIVGVNDYRIDESQQPRPASQRPAPGTMETYLQQLQTYKVSRSRKQVQAALSDLQRACNTPAQNVFERIVDAAVAGLTHGEICACLRRELGFGQPLVIV
ncbi:MAG: acyl-CoA mutase large subunit family protein, partial [Gammaproteobacteria bacterium]|nr:acyl-CoA mutase large subunit family protein [Gammaproteobacteria bacterium]